MTGDRPSMLVRVLNAALGLELADFADARELMLSDEGAAMIEDWLTTHRGDPGDDET